MDTTIATTIKNQIGAKACYMIGAKYFIALENGLRFEIGKNSEKIKKVEITLNAMDTYDIKFWGKRASDWMIISQEDGIYADGLKNSIERNTGLYTSL